MTELLAKLTRPRMVKSHPFQYGDHHAHRIHAKKVLGRRSSQQLHAKHLLLRSEDFFGMNSVSMVVTILKMSIEPIPKKKLAIIYQLGAFLYPAALIWYGWTAEKGVFWLVPVCQLSAQSLGGLG
jgi:hypothetical protein